MKDAGFEVVVLDGVWCEETVYMELRAGDPDAALGRAAAVAKTALQFECPEAARIDLFGFAGDALVWRRAVSLRGGEITSEPSPSAEDLTPIEEKRRVAEIQGLLTGLGYDAGPSDGLMGRRTTAAIRAFEADSGLAPAGRPGADVLRALRRAFAARPDPAPVAPVAAARAPQAPAVDDGVVDKLDSVAPVELFPRAGCERLASGAAAAGGGEPRRLAFLVGMSDYGAGVPPLRNPLNDIQAMARSFLGLGFTVYYAANATGDEVEACAAQAREAVPEPEVTALYFSGHGVQINDENYLVAVDARAGDGLGAGFVPANDLIDRLRADAGATLVFLDACRDNPFAADGRAGLSASTVRGFAPRAGAAAPAPAGGSVQARGVFISYATSPNTVALDGDGDLSPFAEALSKYVVTPGYSIQRVMSAVTDSVGEATGWAQTPWTRSSLTTELKLAGALTAEEAQSGSENWARRSRVLLEQGRRHEAIAAALKGLPPEASEASARRGYPPAFEALSNAYFSGNAVFPASRQPGFSDRLLHGFWMAPNRERYVVGYGDQDEKLNFSLHRASDGALITTLIDARDTPDYLTMVAISPDSRLVAVTIDDETSVWRLADGALVSRFDSKPLTNPTGLASRNVNLVFSPSGRRLLGVVTHGAAYGVMDAERGAVLEVLDASSLTARSPAFGAFSARGQQSLARLGFVDDDRLCAAAFSWRRNDTAAGAPVGSGLFGAVGGYELGAGRLSGFAELPARLPWENVGAAHCSADGRWMALSGAEEATPSEIWFIDRRDGAVIDRIQTTSDSAYTVFDETSRFAAVAMEEGAFLYDVQARKVVAEGVGDFSASVPRLFNENGDAIAAELRHTPAYAHALLKPGADLVAAAAAVLGPELRAEVEAERVRYRSPR